MPIRLNLLAEAQAAEDLRRRDPIKRAIYAGLLAVGLVLVWWSWLQLRVMVAHTEVSQIEGHIQSRTNTYQVILASEKKINEAKHNLAVLQELTQDRFPQGNLLNALQQATVPGVHLMKLRVNQTYTAAEAAKSKAGEGHTAAHPATVTEGIVVTLDARDYSSNPGDQVNKFKDAISQQPYFAAELDKTNGVRLTNLSPPQLGADAKPSVMFTLQCTYPDRTR
jgi:hypothetical protein